MNYTIIVKRKDKKDMVREGVDRLNAIIISAELKEKFKKQIDAGEMEVIIKKEGET